MFRVISADYYLNNFASDRSHMLNDDNTYSSSPPIYPCIESKSKLFVNFYNFLEIKILFFSLIKHRKIIYKNLLVCKNILNMVH
jgi:hypothetical protein